MIKLPGLDRLGTVGFVGERKAISLLCLGFYTTLFFMIGLSARSELPEWVPVFASMFLVYTTAFISVAAEWFWGRWFAIGLGYWGCTMAIMAFVTTRSFPPALVIFGVMHGLISLGLMGEKMAAVFDAKPAWRERWKLDEQGVLRVRKSVTRMASSLPALIMFALAPREGQSLATFGLPATDALLLGLAAMGIVSMIAFLVTRRTWAVLALGAVGVAVFARALTNGGHLYSGNLLFDPSSLPAAQFGFELSGVFAGAMLIAASLPFAGPIASFVLRGRK
jgi:hypothetical protein